MKTATGKVPMLPIVLDGRVDNHLADALTQAIVSGHIVTSEGPHPRQHLVEHRPERPLVRPFVYDPPVRLLR